ncbi:MAG: fused response regulator/phosphatase [Alphaproteobacteria bacterium]|nr:fused response regulator/phosphatase [Alphaproteobacteria bacterium]
MSDVRALRVLVIEDSETNRRLLDALLRAAGIQTIAFAVDGIDGLEKVESFQPDLVVLDIMMPRMDGFEVCRRLRALPEHRSLPILVQTGLETAQERTEAFRAGATDLVIKPLNGAEFLARVRVHLQNRMLIRDLEDYRARLEGELVVARDMQQSLLPTESLMDEISASHGLRIAAHFEPCSELGGDGWGLADLGDGRVAVWLVDFTGHGVGAAVNTFRLHTLMSEMPPDPSDPARYLAALNARLCGLLRIGQFATFLYGILDTRAHVFTYAGAAGTSPVIGDADGMAAHDASGLPLGISRHGTWQNHSVPFPPGSLLLLYSDALTETLDTQGAMLDEPAVTVLAADSRRAEEPLTALLEVFHRDREPVSDDLTLVWIERTG